MTNNAYFTRIRVKCKHLLMGNNNPLRPSDLNEIKDIVAEILGRYDRVGLVFHGSNKRSVYDDAKMGISEGK